MKKHNTVKRTRVVEFKDNLKPLDGMMVIRYKISNPMVANYCVEQWAKVTAVERHREITSTIVYKEFNQKGCVVSVTKEPPKYSTKVEQLVSLTKIERDKAKELIRKNRLEIAISTNDGVVYDDKSKTFYKKYAKKISIPEDLG